MMKLLIFDLQGTLLENGVYPSPAKQVRAILGIRQQFHDYVPLFEHIFMTKSYPSLTEAFTAVSEGFDLRSSRYSIEKIVGVWNKNRLLSRQFSDFDTLIELRKGYKLALVANIDCFTKDVIEKFKLKDYFDEIFLSCDTGKLKTDEGFFQDILAKFDVAESDAVMIGDSLESDMKPAKKAGIRTILLDRNDRQQYEERIKSLAELKDIL